MNTYISQFFVNGRIAVVPTKDFDEAIEQNKEILIFCGAGLVVMLALLVQTNLFTLI